VDVAGGVTPAWEKLSKVSYDAALFDVALPDGDGVALLEQLRRTGNELPVVMMSGHATIDAACAPPGSAPPTSSRSRCRPIGCSW